MHLLLEKSTYFEKDRFGYTPLSFALSQKKRLATKNWELIINKSNIDSKTLVYAFQCHPELSPENWDLLLKKFFDLNKNNNSILTVALQHKAKIPIRSWIFLIQKTNCYENDPYICSPLETALKYKIKFSEKVWEALIKKSNCLKTDEIKR
jgi:hypothetical protein